MAKLPEYFHFRVLAGGTEIGIQDVSDHDFVEVVRCKDCMLRQYCKVAQYLGEDGFCSNGEKREEN